MTTMLACSCGRALPAPTEPRDKLLRCPACGRAVAEAMRRHARRRTTRSAPAAPGRRHPLLRALLSIPLMLAVGASLACTISLLRGVKPPGTTAQTAPTPRP